MLVKVGQMRDRFRPFWDKSAGIIFVWLVDRDRVAARKGGQKSPPPEMAKQWPFTGKRSVRDGCSDYYRYGTDKACQDEKTKIKLVLKREMTDGVNKTGGKRV
ncbi:hypothetical protein AFM40_000159 [Escherichia coli]|nr:hypothetical protein [Escherichia coli]EFJ5338842.1 hypothetical protein [Escherichia coli]HEI3996928.1 hypothetical protein [Escherichia coli]